MTRTERRLVVKEGRKLFSRALITGEKVEAGLKCVVNKLPLFARVKIALRIIFGAWK